MRNVIFDLGGVLVEWNPTAILERLYPETALRSRIMQAIFKHADWVAMDRGTLHEAEAIIRFGQRTQRPHGELEDLLRQIMESLRPLPETVELLRELAARGVPLYCLSNMPVPTYEFLRRQHDFFGCFRGIMVSGEVKLVKPEREIFEHMSARFGLAPADTILIDDHQPNINAAKALGFATIHFESARQCRERLRWLLSDSV